MQKEDRTQPKDDIDFPIHWNHSGYRIVSTTRRTTKDRFRIALNPYFLGFNQVAVDAPIHHPSHKHSSFELIAVKEGPYRCKLNGDPIKLDTTHCLLIKPGDVHEVDCRPGQKHYVLQFDLEEKELEDKRTIFIFNKTIRTEAQAFPIPIQEVEPVLKAIAAQTQDHSGHRFASEIQDTLTELLFWTLLSYIPEERLAPAFRKMSNDQRFLDKLERTAKSNAAKHLSLDKLAEIMEVSKSTLAKRCTTLLGESPSQYLVREKIATAVKLISTTNMRIKEISFELGFQNPYHFSRVFKRVTGKSPSDFRLINDPDDSKSENP